MQPKLVGTFVPVFSLRTKKSAEVGTFIAGINFLPWLAATHQNAWQMLPINETQLENGSSSKHIPSPYKSYGIGIDPRYLSKDIKTPTPSPEQVADFVLLHSQWISDYALFCAIRDEQKTDDWIEWEYTLRLKDTPSVERFRRTHEKEIKKHIVTQWKLHYQFGLLKSRARDKGINLIGDMPFYIAHRSPLVWANRELFNLEADGTMENASGVPESKGVHFIRQFWGHPLYLWGHKDRMPWVLNFWKMRIQYLAGLYDWIRLDHAGGFYNFGSLSVEDSKHDRFLKGPGTKVLEEIVKYFAEAGVGVYLENIGENQSELNREIVGANMFQTQVWIYGFWQKNSLQFNVNNAQIAKYNDRMFVYTTTHDSETLINFVEMAKRSGIIKVRDTKEYCRRIIKAISNSKAFGVIIPIQDRLFASDRINIPGTEKEINDKNWKYILKTPVEDLPVDNQHDS